jgi:putative ABC transport system substrate-binding protein
MLGIRRRDLITVLAGAAVAWPVRLRAQSRERMRRIGVLVPAAADDSEYQARVGAFLQGLQQSGWSFGQNVRIDTRWAGANPDDIRRHATELAALAPDAILVNGGFLLGALQRATRTVPIVFVNVSDPVGAGYVESLARPGGNATGFAAFEFTLSGKWPELLKQIAPGIMRVAVLRDPSTAAGTGQFAVVQAAAQSLRMEVTPIGVQDAGGIERSIPAFARLPTGGLIVTAGAWTSVLRDRILVLGAKYKLPGIYYERAFVTRGGLISYGQDQLDPFRRAAGYVDLILKGMNPSELPVQYPTKYEMVLNTKTAKTLGLVFPPGLFAIADEIIE